MESFRKSKILTAKFLGEKIKADKDLMMFFPDHIRFESVARDLLLSFVYHVKRPMYEEFKSMRDREVEIRSLKNYHKFSVFITEEFKSAIVTLPELKGNLVINN